MIVETIEIIRWLRDKADRADSLSWTRMMHTAADRLQILEMRLKMAIAERDAATKRMIELEMEVNKPRRDLTPQVYKKGFQPVGFEGFAKACPTCKNIGSEYCRECKCERKSGYDHMEVANE